MNWFNLFVFVPSPDPVDTITCGGDSFVMCIVLPGQFGYFATVAFEGGPGITNGQVFFADLGASRWMANVAVPRDCQLHSGAWNPDVDDGWSTHAGGAKKTALNVALVI